MSRREGVLVFLAAVAARLLLWLPMSGHPGAYLRPDSLDYLRLAQGLLHGGVFGSAAAAESFRVPGYPALLAALGTLSFDPRWLALANLLLDSATAALIAGIAARLAPGRWSWAVGLLYAFDPAVAAHAVLVLSEAPFNFVLVLGLGALLRAGPAARPGWAAAGGLALAAAALIRPVALYAWIPLGLALAALWSREGRAALAAFLLAATLPTGLWCLRNFALFGHFAFTSISGANLYLYEAPAVLAQAEGVPVESAARELAADFTRAHPRPFSDPFEESRLRRLATERLLRARPAAAVKAHAAAAFKMLAGPALDLLDEELEPGRAPPASAGAAGAGAGTRALLAARPALWLLLILSLASLAATYALAASGARALWRRDRFAASLLLTLTAYLLLVSVGGWAYYRFRVPLWPGLCLLASGALLESRAHA